MNEIINDVSHNKIVMAFIFAVIIDTFYGLIRAIKDKETNSTIGIDGSIRKIAMIGTIAFLYILDIFLQINVTFFIPSEWLQIFGTDKIGLCEFFSILYVIFESLSILKNMALVGLPIPKLQEFLTEKLKYFTDELNKK